MVELAHLGNGHCIAIPMEKAMAKAWSPRYAQFFAARYIRCNLTTFALRRGGVALAGWWGPATHVTVASFAARKKAVLTSLGGVWDENYV
jgi:hypothetical protein